MPYVNHALPESSKDLASPHEPESVQTPSSFLNPRSYIIPSRLMQKAEIYEVNVPHNLEGEYQLLMHVKTKLPKGEVRIFRYLLDTGAEEIC